MSILKVSRSRNKNYPDKTCNDTCTVQGESSKFASVWFDQGFQIWVGWNWSKRHLLVICIDPIVPGFVVYYVNNSENTSHSANVATSTEWCGVKIDGLLPPNFCRFQKYKRKVPPPSLLNNEKSPFTPSKVEKKILSILTPCNSVDVAT